MKTGQQGSAITAAAVSAAIVSILVAGFLTYTINEERLNQRSHYWAAALQLAEAAAEIGIAEFTYQYSQGGSGFTSGRGWTSLGGGSYTKTVSNFTNNGGATIGHLQVQATGIGVGTPQITGIGTVTAKVGSANVARAVRVGFAGGSMFPAGLLSKSTISMNGNASIDSYDSTDPSKSTSGEYDSSKRQANGHVGALASSGTAISMNGNTAIYGTAAVGGSGTMSMAGNAAVGPVFSGQASTPSTAAANGWLAQGYSATVSDVTLPSGLSSAPSLGTINSSSTINGGDYQASGISLSGNRTVQINGTVRLYVNGSTSISGNAKIQINPGGKLEVYTNGSISISGNGVLNNAVTPTQNQWFGLPGCTSVSMSGNANWVGTIYAPQAAISTSGNGEFSGAIVGNSITVSGNGTYHYDESLNSLTGSSSYSIASWQELRPSGGTWVP